MKLEGSLAVYPLRELLEMILYSSVTGALVISGKYNEGTVFFDNGQPYHATLGSLTGLDAVAILCEERDASFSFVDDSRSIGSSLWGDALDLIDRVEKLSLRWGLIRPTLQSVRAIPRFTAPLEELRPQLGNDYQELYAAINGRLSLDVLARSIHWDLIAVCEIVAQLVKRGLVGLEAPSNTPGLIVTYASSANKQKPTLLDRLMATIPATALEPEIPEPPPPPPAAAPVAPPAAAAAPPPPQTAEDAQSEAVLRILRQSGRGN